MTSRHTSTRRRHSFDYMGMITVGTEMARVVARMREMEAAFDFEEPTVP